MHKPVFLLFLLAFCAQAIANGGDSDKNNRDTSSAVVVYDAGAKFFPDLSYDERYYKTLIDSLVKLDTVPVALVNQLNVYRSLSKRGADNLNIVIDSIFQLEEVPQHVLNAVNIYMSAAQNALAAPTGFAAYIPESALPYPAGAFYQEWNTSVPNPFRNNLMAFDSCLKLLLVDTLQNCGFVQPVKGVVTSNFGWRYGRNHNGIDIDLEVWDPVQSAFPGVVRVARYYKGYGRVVVVRHFNGLETIYAHLHRFKVKPGDEVEAGGIVGLGGSSGNSTGSHLHFEMRFQGVPIQPSQVIDFSKHQLRSDVLCLRKSGAFLAAIPEGRNIYKVKKGDYLYKIARQFGLSLEDICAMNNINRHKNLKAGQKLIVGS
jgi:murein DD-endopeptidase MepM/ murein hydrolase activator NlpD